MRIEFTIILSPKTPVTNGIASIGISTARFSARPRLILVDLRVIQGQVIMGLTGPIAERLGASEYAAVRHFILLARSSRRPILSSSSASALLSGVSLAIKFKRQTLKPRDPRPEKWRIFLVLVAKTARYGNSRP
mgnify:CR=1 FL=1